MERYKHGIP